MMIERERKGKGNNIGMDIKKTGGCWVRFSVKNTNKLD